LTLPRLSLDNHAPWAGRGSREVNLAAQESIMNRTSILLGATAVLVAAACTEQNQPKPQPQPAPAKPVAKTPDAGASTDARGDARLGMMERHAIWKAKKEADEKLAAQLAAEEKARLFKFDKAKLPKHQAMFAFEVKTRKALDEAVEKLNGKLDAEDQLKKLAASQRKPIEAQAKILRTLDPKGGNSNIGTDHDVYLNLLANDYPEAILAFFEGQTKPLADVRSELDKREKKMAAWLEELSAGGKK
jgi:hypothetical protein